MQTTALISLPPAPAYTPAAGVSAALPSLPSKVPAAAANPTSASDQSTEKQAENQRYQAIQQAASTNANLFVLGDHRFTIFKDSTGQYITRYTSLRDGSVTYVPEPQMIPKTQHTPTITLNA